jgi:hypothetical protein
MLNISKKSIYKYIYTRSQRSSGRKKTFSPRGGDGEADRSVDGEAIEQASAARAYQVVLATAAARVR